MSYSCKNLSESDDYVFINEDEYFLNDDEEWEDAEHIVLRDTEWPETFGERDDDSVDLSQSPSCASVGSLIEDEQVIDYGDVDEVGMKEKIDIAASCNDMQKCESQFRPNSKEVFDPHTDQRVATSKVSKSNNSRMCNKKRRAKMKKVRESIAKSEAAASRSRNAYPETANDTSRSETRTRSFNNICASLTNINTTPNTTSKIAMMCAKHALTTSYLNTNHYTHNLNRRSKYAILL